jgi:hypothetical protein
MTDGGVHTGYYFIKPFGMVKLNRSISIFLIISKLFAQNHAVIKLHKQDQFCFARAFSIALFNSAKAPS